MTDLEITTGTNADFLTSFIIFWVVLVVGFLLVYRYVWPIVEHAYIEARRALYWVLRNYCSHDGYDGYGEYLNRRKDRS